MCQVSSYSWWVSMKLATKFLLLIKYFNQWSYNQHPPPLCLPYSKPQQAAVISVYQAGYWCWPWQRSVTRWADSQTSRQKSLVNDKIIYSKCLQNDALSLLEVMQVYTDFSMKSKSILLPVKCHLLTKNSCEILKCWKHKKANLFKVW